MCEQGFRFHRMAGVLETRADGETMELTDLA